MYFIRANILRLKIKIIIPDSVGTLHLNYSTDMNISKIINFNGKVIRIEKPPANTEYSLPQRQNII